MASSGRGSENGGLVFHYEKVKPILSTRITSVNSHNMSGIIHSKCQYIQTDSRVFLINLVLMMTLLDVVVIVIFYHCSEAGFGLTAIVFMDCD